MVTTTVASMAALDRRGWRAGAPSDFQSNVSADTMTMMATSAITGTCDTPVFQRHHGDEQKHPGKQRGRAPAPAMLHVAHGLADHSAARNAAKAAGRDVGQPPHSSRFLSLGCRSPRIDHGGGEHRFEQATTWQSPMRAAG